MGKVVNIIFVELSGMIGQGISAILSDSGLNHKTIEVESLRKFEEVIIRNIPDIVIVNPAIVQNQAREFQILKNKLPDTSWMAVVYALTDQQILSMFDGVLYINDSPGKIVSAVQKLLISDHQLKPGQENLTERETDVLKLLVTGNANKEIADKLNISTHTVISHRKNISQKTGIKSVSGLTIYAVLKNIISVRDYME
jgi:DNA-binding NarL/FixJ family response regulator